MRNRLARALLRLTRVDCGNYEQVKAQFEPALWLRRCRMEVLLRGRAPPDDDTKMEREMLGEFKEISWVTMWDGWGDHDRYHSGQASKEGEERIRDPRECPHGKVGLCAECDMEKEWGSPQKKRQRKKVRLEVRGKDIELCKEHGTTG